MRTNFTAAQLADPLVREVNDIFRKCVHCGFCTATCPTYVLLGDETDSPRGRVHLIQDMLEKEGRPSAAVVKHLDRCLTCLSCVTTCPSGVDYMHLIDHARVRIEENYRRPWAERLLRSLLAAVLTDPGRFRLALRAAVLARPLRALLPGRLGAMAGMAPARLPAPSPMDRPQVFPALGTRRQRMALMTGCAQRVLRPAINEATVRLLTRHGIEVVIAEGAGCCGALVHHLGREEQARTAARANVAAWERVAAEEGGLDAVVVNASGCGVTVKDYGHLLRDDPEWAEPAARIAALARDPSEILEPSGLMSTEAGERPRVAYHSPCSMQHGQGLVDEPARLLEAAGFEVARPAEGHICCGSAGTYNLLQPDLAARLRERKVGNLEALEPGVIATGNIGCIEHLSAATRIPVVHAVELLDWATGGPRPAGMG